jgi:exodeoxyribonuclease VII large subunit
MRLYAAQLEQRSPLAKLSGGYGYISDAQGRAVLSAGAVATGDILNIQLKGGRIEAAVERVHRGRA